jgi:hypothetical protein
MTWFVERAGFANAPSGIPQARAGRAGAAVKPSSTETDKEDNLVFMLATCPKTARACHRGVKGM